MGSEVAFHLSGGIFFNLMLAARKKPTVNQKECLRELLYIFDRSARGLSGNSLGTIASRFRNCDPKLRSVYIKFGDPVLVNEFNERMREDYDSVVGEVKNYADHYLDLKMNGKWLVRALMELVEKDSLIQNNAKFMAIPGGRPAYKQDFPEMQKVYIYNMLLGVWHFICSRTDGEEYGQETYFALSDFDGESRARKFDCGRIGFKDHEDVLISYDMEIKPCFGENTHFSERVLCEHLLSGEIEKLPSVKIMEDHGPLSEALSSKIRQIVSMQVEKSRVPAKKVMVNKYQTYLDRAYEKHRKKKTFLYEMQREFYGFFVCNDVKRR